MQALGGVFDDAPGAPPPAAFPHTGKSMDSFEGGEGLCSAFLEPLNYRLMSRAPMADLAALITSALATTAKRNLTGVRHQLEAPHLPRQKSGVSHARHIIMVPS